MIEPSKEDVDDNESRGSRHDVGDKDKLMHSRRSYLGKLTKCMKDLDEVLTPDGTESTIRKFWDLAQRSYERFITAHKSYTSVIKNAEEIEAEDKVAYCQKAGLEEKRTRVEQWLAECARDRQVNVDRLCKQRRSSSRSSNSSQYSQATAKRKVAELKLRQLKRQQEDERRLEEVTRQCIIRKQEEVVEMAALEQQLEDQQINDEDENSVEYNVNSLIPVPTYPKCILLSGAPSVIQENSKFNTMENNDQPPYDINIDAARSSTHQENPDVRSVAPPCTTTLETMVGALRQVVERKTENDWPKPNLPIFRGNPAEYPYFIHAIENKLHPRVKNKALRLDVLIEHCEGQPRDDIKGCVFLNGGYTEARRLLYERYGRPHTIVQSQLNSLLYGPNIKIGNAEGLMNLATEMRNCISALSGLNYSSTVDDPDNIVKVMWRLPHELQTRWAHMERCIIDTEREPNFNDLCNFVMGEAKTATSFYGQNIKYNSRNERMSAKQNVRFGPNVLNVKAEPFAVICPFCSEFHFLDACESFCGLSYNERR